MLLPCSINSYMISVSSFTYTSKKSRFLIRLLFILFLTKPSHSKIFFSHPSLNSFILFFPIAFSAHRLAAFPSFALSQNFPSNLPLFHCSTLSLLVFVLMSSTSLQLYSPLFQIFLFFMEAHKVYPSTYKLHQENRESTIQSDNNINVIIPFVIFKLNTSLCIRHCTGCFSFVNQKCGQKRACVCTAATEVLTCVQLKTLMPLVERWSINLRTAIIVMPSYFVKFCQGHWKERPKFSNSSKCFSG